MTSSTEISDWDPSSDRTNEDEHIDIAIIGGGLAGLATALALIQADRKLKVKVFEHRCQPQHKYAAGLLLEPNGLKAAGAISHKLLRRIRRNAVETKSVVLYDMDDAPVGRIESPCAQYKKQYKQPTCVIGWSEMEKLLLGLLPSHCVHFGVKYSGYKEEDGRISFKFERGSGGQGGVKCKVLVGADGPRSAVRKQCLNDAGPDFEDCVMWSGRLPGDIVSIIPSSHQAWWISKGQAFKSHPLPDGDICWEAMCSNAVMAHIAGVRYDPHQQGLVAASYPLDMEDGMMPYGSHSGVGSGSVGQSGWRGNVDQAVHRTAEDMMRAESWASEQYYGGAYGAQGGRVGSIPLGARGVHAEHDMHAEQRPEEGHDYLELHHPGSGAAVNGSTCGTGVSTRPGRQYGPGVIHRGAGGSLDARAGIGAGSTRNGQVGRQYSGSLTGAVGQYARQASMEPARQPGLPPLVDDHGAPTDFGAIQRSARAPFQDAHSLDTRGDTAQERESIGADVSRGTATDLFEAMRTARAEEAGLVGDRGGAGGSRAANSVGVGWMAGGGDEEPYHDAQDIPGGGRGGTGDEGHNGPGAHRPGSSNQATGTRSVSEAGRAGDPTPGAHGSGQNTAVKPLELLHLLFDHFPKPVDEMLSDTYPDSVVQSPIYSRSYHTMPSSLGRGRVVLVGEAATPLCPTGQAENMSLEDAAELGRVVGKYGVRKEALREFERARRPRWRRAMQITSAQAIGSGVACVGLRQGHLDYTSDLYHRSFTPLGTVPWWGPLATNTTATISSLLSLLSLAQLAYGYQQGGWEGVKDAAMHPVGGILSGWRAVKRALAKRAARSAGNAVVGVVDVIQEPVVQRVETALQGRIHRWLGMF